MFPMDVLVSTAEQLKVSQQTWLQEVPSLD